jgi:hypothetical protein
MLYLCLQCETDSEIKYLSDEYCNISLANSCVMRGKPPKLGALQRTQYALSLAGS